CVVVRGGAGSDGADSSHRSVHRIGDKGLATGVVEVPADEALPGAAVGAALALQYRPPQAVVIGFRDAAAGGLAPAPVVGGDPKLGTGDLGIGNHGRIPANHIPGGMRDAGDPSEGIG